MKKYFKLFFYGVSCTLPIASAVAWGYHSDTGEGILVGYMVGYGLIIAAFALVLIIGYCVHGITNVIEKEF